MKPRGHPLRVPLERLQRRDPVREWSVTVAAADVGQGEPLRVADVSLDPDTDIAVEVVLDLVSEGVMVTGSVGSPWVGECARCLRQVRGRSDAEVTELFELRPTEGESYLLDHEVVDLGPMVRDAVLLELPIEVIRCADPAECEAAQAELGELSESVTIGEPDADGEDRAVADPRWAALDELRFDDDT